MYLAYVEREAIELGLTDAAPTVQGGKIQPKLGATVKKLENPVFPRGEHVRRAAVRVQMADTTEELEAIARAQAHLPRVNLAIDDPTRAHPHPAAAGRRSG